ncbi:MAG: SPOR domain-containing protein [Candidatus Acidiferrales bacterium]
MSGSGRRGGGERVLESRHLVGLFLGVVLLCGVFFTLGYVMGRTQFGGPVQASAAPVRPLPSTPVSPKPKESQPAAQPATSEWDFYGKKDTNHLEPAPKNAAPAPAAIPAVASKTKGEPPAASTKSVSAPAKPSSVPIQSQRLPKGSFILQVAALSREGDALKMAEEIQGKKFPAFVATLPSDSLFHVQVGPYTDEKSAESAKHSLEQVGFKSIIKR